MGIYVYGLILAAYLVLGFLSRDSEGTGIRKMAGFIYHKWRRFRQKSARGPAPGESAVHRDLVLLYPFGRMEKEEEKFHVERIRLVLMIILAGDILAAAGYAAAGANMLLAGGNALIRDEIGGDDRSTELEAYIVQEGEDPAKEESGKEDLRQGSYTLEVRSRKYSEAQARELAKKAFAQLESSIAGNNTGLDHVTMPLELPAGLEGYPFSIAWESSSYALVDSTGVIGNSGMKEGESRSAVLTAVLTYDNGVAGGLRFEKNFDVTVMAPELSSEDRLTAQIKEAIRSADEESVSEQTLPLPQKFGEQTLRWEEKPADPGPALLLFAAALGFLGAASMGSRLHERVIGRERQMKQDYPQIISKFVLYLGAGLSVRSTFVKLGEDYSRQREEGMEERGAYEEILLVCRELASGVPETQAYAGFGQRCRSRQYTKLSTLLAQNLRKGNQELLAVMQQEAQASFEERRNSARKLGEEAETKLLLPMIMMLAITMLIIIIPAYYSFAV